MGKLRVFELEKYLAFHEEKTISDDDYSCDESDADDEVIVVMSGDDSETISDVENEEQNIDDLSDKENNIVWEQACNLIENRTRSGRIVRSRRYNDIWTYLWRYVFFSNNNAYPLTVQSNSNLKYLGG